MRSFSGLGGLDPTIVTSIVQGATSVAASSIDLAKAVQLQKAASNPTKKAAKKAPTLPPPVQAPPPVPAPASTSPVVAVLLGGVLTVGLFLAYKSTRNAAQFRSR
jgi:hypothetical protein